VEVGREVGAELGDVGQEATREVDRDRGAELVAGLVDRLDRGAEVVADGGADGLGGVGEEAAGGLESPDGPAFLWRELIGHALDKHGARSPVNLDKTDPVLSKERLYELDKTGRGRGAGELADLVLSYLSLVSVDAVIVHGASSVMS
jgi:hypothetical protein